MVELTDAAVAADLPKRDSHVGSAEEKTANETAPAGRGANLDASSGEEIADFEPPPGADEAPEATVVAAKCELKPKAMPRIKR